MRISDRSSDVCSSDLDAAGMLKLSDRAFLVEAEMRMGGFLGALSTLKPRASYPLGFHHAATITAERLALVGEDRKSVVEGKSVSVRIGLGGSRLIKQTTSQII